MFRFRDGLWCETLGDDVLVLDANDTVVHHLSGDPAAVARLILAGSNLDDLPAPIRSGLDELVNAGLLSAPAGWSRRRLLRVGLTATGVGIVSMALPPSQAAASHGVPWGAPTAFAGSDYTYITFTATGTITLSESAGGGAYTTVSAAATSPFTRTGRTPGTSYAYKVATTGDASTLSAASNAVTPAAVALGGARITSNVFGPGGGTGLGYWSRSSTQIIVDFNKNSRAVTLRSTVNGSTHDEPASTTTNYSYVFTIPGAIGGTQLQGMDAGFVTQPIVIATV